jgi:catechol-2,3-dioxygenase
LGHVGIFCADLATMRSFYTEQLGLTITDEKPGMVCFLSSRPAQEHHEVVLIRGRTAPPEAVLLQQISFRCAALADVLGFYRRLKEQGTRFDMLVCHGNAVGAYFRDPEGNRAEVYWDTGRKVHQPFLHPVDMDQPLEMLAQQVEEIIARYGETGYLAPELSAAQRKGAAE